MLRHSYSYLERRYSKKTRLEVLVLVVGMAAVLIGGLVAVQMSDTDGERNTRAKSEFKPEKSLDRKNLIEQQEYYLRVVCEQSKDACAKAQELIRKQNCQLFGESCTQKLKRR
jgi:hypothetical protein